MPEYTNNKSGGFTKATSKIKKFVLEEYLPAKIANYMGISLKNMTDDTIVKVDFPYANSEGVIPSLEKESGVKGLRIDLQKSQHIGQNDYATWQVQFGTGMKNGGAYAGVLMRVSTSFTLGELKEALSKSFDWLSYCRLDP